MSRKDLKANIRGLFIGALILNPPINLIMMAAQIAVIASAIAATIGVIAAGTMYSMEDNTPSYEPQTWVAKVTPVSEEEQFNGQGLA